MKRSILLSGGAGYIGSHTYVALIEAGYDVVILDNFENAQRDVPDRLELITKRPVIVEEVDVLDTVSLARVFSTYKFDGVVHFAAKKAVGESVCKPLDYFETNIVGLINLLRAMQNSGVHRLVFSSSATVYGDPVNLPVDENAELSFSSPYGFTKLAGEQILSQFTASNPHMAVGTLRYFNPAGAHSSALIGEDPSGIPNNLMPYIAKVATGEMEALKIFGDDYETRDGTGVRDYIHVEDLALGHVLSLNALLESGENHMVNLGTGVGYSVLEMLKAYSQACGRTLPYTISARRSGDIAAVYANPSLASDLLGFKARKNLDEMCVSSWKWVSRQRNSGQD